MPYADLGYGTWIACWASVGLGAVDTVAGGWGFSVVVMLFDPFHLLAPAAVLMAVGVPEEGGAGDEAGPQAPSCQLPEQTLAAAAELRLKVAGTLAWRKLLKENTDSSDKWQLCCYSMM